MLYQAKDGIIVLLFKMNQDYIAQNYCENKDKPHLYCNGNCVFMKAMKETQKENYIR